MQKVNPSLFEKLCACGSKANECVWRAPLAVLLCEQDRHLLGQQFLHEFLLWGLTEAELESAGIESGLDGADALYV